MAVEIQHYGISHLIKISPLGTESPVALRNKKKNHYNFTGGTCFGGRSVFSVREVLF